MTGKTLMKSVLKHIHRHRKLAPDVYIFTLPRAGSTLLLEILNTDPHSKTASEPHALNKHNRQVLLRYFPQGFLQERYTDVTQDEFRAMQQYFADLSSGKTWNSYYWSDFPGRDHKFRTGRTLYKTQKITYLFADFMQAFPADYGLYLLRHPIPHSLSRIRNGWDSYIRQYLESEKIKKNISPKAQNKANALLKNGSWLERFVASWCLENFVFFFLKERNALPEKLLPVYYEKLVAQTGPALQSICRHVGMPFTRAMLEKAGQPSHGIVHSTGHTITQIKQGENASLLSKWRDKISPQDEEKAFDVLYAFHISLYQPGKDMPR